MITRFATFTSRLCVAFAFLFAFTACGGGGGGNGGFYEGEDDTTTYYVAIELVDAQGNPTNIVDTSGPTTVRVKITKNGKNGSAIADVVVAAQVTAGILSPASGTALTDSSGVALFQLLAETGRAAGTFTASVDGPSGTVTGTASFQIGSANIRLGYVDENGSFIENEIGISPASALAFQGSAQLSLAILDTNGNYVNNNSESVTFSSGCLSSGQAVLDPPNPIVTGNGRVNTTYSSTGCTGNDTITASVEGSSAQAFGTVSIASAQANRVLFVDATPTTIVLKGTGGTPDRPESSIVTFQAVDAANNPLQGISVQFSLSTTVGGLSFTPTTAVSGVDGTVKVNVSSGNVPTVVRAIATTQASDGSGQQVSTVSDLLTVSTGVPDQNSISLSVAGGFVVEDGFTIDGVTRTITVRMADQFNNPVPDGTAASFHTEYGSIEPSCETTNGSCSVTWTSQAPRFPTLTGSQYVKTIYSPGYKCPSTNAPSGPCPDDLGYTRGGRSTVTVTAIGEESFVDRNGNGIMDEDEQNLFENLTEAFWDYNEDGVWTPADDACQGEGANTPRCIAGQEEEFVDFNDNGVYDTNQNPAQYNGLRCPIEGDGVWCKRSLLNVWDEAVLILSADPNWDIAVFQGRNAVSTVRASVGTYKAYVSDLYNSRPPAGSTVSLEADGCEILGESSFEVPNSAAYGAFGFQFQVGGTGEEAGTLTITLQPTGEAAPYSETFTCVPEPPPVDDCDVSPLPPECPQP